MFRPTGFEKLFDKATSHLLMDPDWPSIIQICDLIRQNDVQPKTALAAVKKKLNAPSPYTALYALIVLESMVKNCGTVIHEELTSKAFCDFLHDLVKTTPHENVRQKLLELIQTWSYAFRKNPKHGALKEIMAQMKAEGYKFPALRESDAMFAADTAPEWADGDICYRCKVQFSMINRKHHCRACGQVFCGQCTSRTTTLPKYGIEKEVRVCDSCYDKATKPSASKPSKAETELPSEYLKSSLAQQSQEPPKKTEAELREEEELQLALALSQSEAEAKEKEKLKVTQKLHNTYSAVKSEARSPSPSEPEQQNPELAKYLNRSYWESLQSNDGTNQNRPTSPSAPSPAPSLQSNESKYESKLSKLKENGVIDTNLEEFINTLRSQVEIFINRMKSNSSRGRSIANDTSVQTLFMNITAMHSRLLKYIQEHDDSRLHYEGLQDKITQVKDARAALDALREEHREKLRREAEEAERLRQQQMAQKLEIMRKKKQEYLQYQRQLALQRIQEQEREMQMRQEQQKHQYLMSGQYGFIGSPVHGQQFVPPAPSAQTYYGQYGQQNHMIAPPGAQGTPIMGPRQQGAQVMGPPPTGSQGPLPQGIHSHNASQGYLGQGPPSSATYNPQQPGIGILPGMQGPPQPLPPGLTSPPRQPNFPNQPPSHNMQFQAGPQVQGGPNQGPPMGPNMPPMGPQMQGGVQDPQMSAHSMSRQSQLHQPSQNNASEAQTAELISFD